MELKVLINELIKVRNEYPTLTNDEVLKIMELKILMEIKTRLNK